MDINVQMYKQLETDLHHPKGGCRKMFKSV